VARSITRWLAAWLASLAWSALVAADATRPGHAARPWWDDFPTLVQAGDAALAARLAATGSLCGAADDPTWGILAQRIRYVSFPGRAESLHERGLKALTWIEGFGTAHAYIVQVKRDPQGQWLPFPAAPEVPQVFCNAWGWEHVDGTGEVRWIGIHNYFDPDDLVPPFSRLHPRYGCPPLTYPDGRPATGFLGSADTPWTHRVFDAGCAKNVLGKVWFENDELNAEGTGGDGHMLAVVPDPGYTPEEWSRLRVERLRQRKTLQVSAGKDSACPVWTDYARASVRQALDLGIDGLWVDNFSPWDSFNARPLVKAFGEWSVAGFREFLRTHVSGPRRTAAGIGDPAAFDIRQYLQERCRQWGGKPQDLHHPAWRDPRWLDDPVWRAYLVYKRRTGTAALSRFYRAIKEEAAAAGKPDFPVLGNDIPMFALGWPRGDLDMVSTELDWGWSLSGGARGAMPPPLGSYVPVYKLAREHARSRFVNVWMYVPDKQLGKEGIASVLDYQGLASHALPMPYYPHRRDAGSETVDAAFFRFVREVAPSLGDRRPVETVGLYASSSSQLAAFTPAGVLRFNEQTHAFSFWGWGTALTWLHAPWRALPEWKLTAEEMSGLRLLIIPSAEVFPAEDVPLLRQWVAEKGGALVVAGACGGRQGESAFFDPAPASSTLASLTEGAGTGGPQAVGRGSVWVLPQDPGIAFYAATDTRPDLLGSFAAALRLLAPDDRAALDAPAVPWHVGLTLYQGPGAHRLFIDANNTRIDLAADSITPTPPLTWRVRLPAAWRGRPVAGRVLAPSPAPELAVRQRDGDPVEVSLSPVSLYACVVLETPAEAPRPGR